MDSSTSDLPAVDSTAKLLQDLRLVGGNRRSKHMDSLEMDLVLEVPDTPDRLATMRLVEDDGEEAGRETYHQSGSNLSIRGEKTSSSNAFDDGSLFRKARLAPLISKPRDAVQYHVKEKFPFGISYPTRCRSDRRKMARDLHGKNEASCSDRLKGMAPSSSGRIRRTHNGIANSLELSDGAHGAEGMNGIAVGSAVLEHCSMNWVAESNCDGNRIGLTSDSQDMTEKAASKPRPTRFERRRLVSNGLISPNNIRENSPSVNEEASSSCVGRSALDKGKGIDLSGNAQDRSEHALFQQCQFDIPWKNSAQRRLVRNGWKSPLNTAKNRNLTDWKRDGIGKMDSREVRDGFLSPQLNVISPDSELRQADEMKGKVYLNCVIGANGQDDAKSSFMSSRELFLPGKETTINETAIADIRPADDIGWRTTHSHAGKAAQLSSSNRKDDSLHSSNQQHESILEDINVNMICSLCGTDSLEAAGPSPFTHESKLSQFQGSSEINFELNPDNERHYGLERLARGKRKSSSSHTLLGECSSSAFIVSDASHPQSSGETSITKSMRGRSSQCHGVTLGPIIDVDELPSPASRSANDHNRSCISSESVARAQQVESDEMLARQLQEQFFSESSNFGGSEEIDATIAWTLQQEEDAQLASFVRSQGQSHPRSPSIAHLYRQYPRQSSHNSSVQSTSRARITPSARMAQLRRNMRREMDLETRLNFLEALEVTFNSGNDPRSDILQVQRDFNENDYEMLLALDEDNHQHMGASLHQINSLPQTVIQTENVEEACAICLEKPSIGDRIRHLPCLHKFHKDCIDTWLRRRTSCPICKSEIT